MRGLVVGGSGMLRGLCLSLAARGEALAVVGRSPHKLQALEQQASGLCGSIAGLRADYGDSRGFCAALDASIEAEGPFGWVVAWIHSTAPDAPMLVARTLLRHVDGLEYFHLLGSASADPARPQPQRRSAFEALEGLSYREVILGFVVEDWGSRWLGDEEISVGVLEAFDAGLERWVVGQVRPWDRRP